MSVKAWDLDDDMEIPWEEQKKISMIYPAREIEEKTKQPGCDISKMEGMRNRLEWVESFNWNRKAENKFYTMYDGVPAMAWPQAVIAFLRNRIRAGGKDMDDVFYLPDKAPPTERDFGEIPPMSSTKEKCDTITLRMKTCPEPLPKRTKSTNIWSGEDASWLRGWHGTSAYSVFGVLMEGKLRAASS